MELTLYACRVGIRDFPDSPALAFRFHPWPEPVGDNCEVRESDHLHVVAPEGAKIADNGFTLECEIEGAPDKLTGLGVFSMARFGLHGFRFADRS